jgi:murein tripeptide amidase MpaA
MFHGLLAFLLDPVDPFAKELRRRFVWKMIPMLNPDGVFHGHFRTDTCDVNLNRCYSAPNVHRHPSIYAAKSVMQQVR